MRQSKTTVIHSESLQDIIIKGFNQLGGLEKLFEESDDILINFGYILPIGYPSNVSFSLIKSITSTLREYGIKNIYAISNPYGGLPLKTVSTFLGLDEFFKEINVQFIYLDGSNFPKLKLEELKVEKAKLLEKVEINGKMYLVPKILKKVKKYIVLTQINGNLRYGVNLALNTMSALLFPENKVRIDSSSPSENQESILKETDVSDIINAYLVRKPDLVINDMRSSISGGGNVPFKGTKFHNYSTSIFGEDPFITDLFTMNILNCKVEEIPLFGRLKEEERFRKAMEQFSWPQDNPIYSDFSKPDTNFKDFYLKNISIVQGDVCSRCYETFYNFINTFQTFLAKDLNYIENSTLLVGENPPNLEIGGSTILFGDCAIHSTSNYHFRTIKSSKTISKENSNSEENSELKAKLSNISDTLKLTNSKKIKYKKNKKILKLLGCPPTIFDCFTLMVQRFGKSNMPQLRLLLEVMKNLHTKRDYKQLNNWKTV